MIKCVIFDVSDTLTLKSKTLEKINPTEIGFVLFERFGYNLDKQKYLDARERALQRYRGNEFDSKAQRFEKGFIYYLIAEECKLQVSQDICEKMEDAYNEIYLENEVVEENIGKTIEWYNEVRPHMSVDLNTPKEAYSMKINPKILWKWLYDDR